MKKTKQDPFDRFFKYSRIVVFLLPFVLYLTTLNLGYVYFDDDVLVLENQSTINQPANLGKIFSTDVFIGKTVPYYRPMLNVALMIGSQIGGADAKAYHLVSVVLHCLTCLSLLWLLGLLGFSKQKSLIGALFFSLHPLIAGAVFWIPALNDILITLFGVLSFACFIKFSISKNWIFFVLHLLFFTGAFFSKESAIALPILFLFYLLFKKLRFFNLQRIILYVSWLAIILIWFVLRKGSIGELQGGEQGLGAILKNMPFLPEIVSAFFLPFNLAVMPVFSLFCTLSGIILLLLFGSMVIFSKEKNMTMILLGLGWFLLFAVPSMFIRQFNTPDSFVYLGHRAYLPAIGLIIMLLATIPPAWADLRKRNIQIIFACFMVIFAVFSLLQERKYKDGEAYWSSVLHVSPDRAWFHHFYGRYYFKQQDLAKFEIQLHEAVRLKPYGTFYYNLGMIELMQKKNYEGAFSYFTKAIEMGEDSKPDVMRNYVNLCIESAVALSKQGENAKAAKRIEKALEYEPSNSSAMMNLAVFSINLGMNQKAVSLWKRVVEIDHSISAYRNLSIYYAKNTNYKDSANYYATQYLKAGGKPEEFPGMAK